MKFFFILFCHTPFFIVVSVKLNGSLIFDCVKNLVNVYIAQCKMVEFNYLESKRCLGGGGGSPKQINLIKSALLWFLFLKLSY